MKDKMSVQIFKKETVWGFLQVFFFPDYCFLFFLVLIKTQTTVGRHVWFAFTCFSMTLVLLSIITLLFFSL